MRKKKTILLRYLKKPDICTVSDNNELLIASVRQIDIKEPNTFNSSSTFNDSEVNSTQIMEYSIYRADQNYTTSTNGTDSSISARAYLTIKYSRGGPTNGYKLTQVSGSWTRLDNAVTLANQALIRYGCSGVANGYGQTASRYQANNFVFNTNFTEYVPLVYGACGANLTLGLSHGSSNWNLYLQNNVS